MNFAITHSGTFHADDVVAASILRLLYPDIEFRRTRDVAVISAVDGTNIVFDVGLRYEHERLRYDHHQFDAGSRSSGCPYASAGLIWLHYGHKVLEKFDAIPDSMISEVWREVDENFIAGIDAVDNAACYSKSFLTADNNTPVQIPSVVAAISVFNPTELIEVADFDGQFEEAVKMTTAILNRNIQVATNRCLGEEMLHKWFRNSTNYRILSLETGVPWKQFAVSKPHLLYAVFPSNGSWYCQCIPKHAGTREYRKLLPASWIGLDGETLARVTGVKNAIFMHKDRYLCAAGDRDGAMRLAELAIAEQ